MSNSDLLENEALNEVLDLICNGDSVGMQTVGNWIRDMIKESLKQTDLQSGQLLISTLQMLDGEVVDEKLQLVRKIFWLFAIAKAVNEVAEDILYDRKTRNGEPCWHVREGVATMAVNDVLLLENALPLILGEILNKHKMRSQIMQLWTCVNFLAAKIRSQSLLDEDSKAENQLLSDTLLNIICPIRFAMILARNITNNVDLIDVADKCMSEQIRKGINLLEEAMAVKQDDTETSCSGETDSHKAQLEELINLVINCKISFDQSLK